MKRDDLLTAAEAAAYLGGISESWLKRARDSGPRRTMIGRNVMFTKAALDEFVERCTEKSEKWDSTSQKTHNSGGQDSKSPVLKSAGAQVKSIADGLRRSSGVSARKLRPMHLVGAPLATKASPT